jgi:hypothetical protein
VLRLVLSSVLCPQDLAEPGNTAAIQKHRCERDTLDTLRRTGESIAPSKTADVMPRGWILLISVVLGALAGVVAYIAWLFDLGADLWWPWALIGGILGLAVGVVAAWWEQLGKPVGS